MSATPISLTQQVWAVSEVLSRRQKGYPALVAKGKLRQSEADFRIAAIMAAFRTLSEIDRLYRDTALAPAQCDLFRTWLKLAADLSGTGAPWPEVENTTVMNVTVGEIVAVARLLTDLATLARRADLVA